MNLCVTMSETEVVGVMQFDIYALVCRPELKNHLQEQNHISTKTWECRILLGVYKGVNIHFISNFRTYSEHYQHVSPS